MGPAGQLVNHQQFGNSHGDKYNHIMALHFLLTVVCMFGIHPSIDAHETTLVNGSAVSPRLLYGETHGVTWTDLTIDHHLPPLVSRMYLHVQGLDFHYNQRWLFYSGLGHIWRLSMVQGRADPEMIVKEAGEASSVAVDWVEDKIYWLSPTTKTVRRTDLEGEGQEVVLEDVKNISRIGNIVVDPYCRLMFVTLDSKGGGVLRAGLEGNSSIRITVELKRKIIHEVVSLTLDVHQRRLFLSARVDNLPMIISCNYGGSSVSRYDLSDTWWNQVTAIGVLGEWFFWVHHDWPGAGSGGDVVWKANSSEGGELQLAKEYKAQTKLLDANPRILALKVYHPDIQSPPTDQEVCQTWPDEVSQPINISARATNEKSSLLMILTTIIFISINKIL